MKLPKKLSLLAVTFSLHVFTASSRGLGEGLLLLLLLVVVVFLVSDDSKEGVHSKTKGRSAERAKKTNDGGNEGASIVDIFLQKQSKSWFFTVA